MRPFDDPFVRPFDDPLGGVGLVEDPLVRPLDDHLGGVGLVEDPLVSLTIGDELVVWGLTIGSFGETIRGSFGESYDRG